MTKQVFLENIQETYRKGLELIKAKNADYAGDEDPFKNFRSAVIAGVDPKTAILVRMLDKIARLGNLLGGRKNKVDERLEDTLLDIINYSAILKALLDDEGGAV
jgi:hypothetical protein